MNPLHPEHPTESGSGGNHKLALTVLLLVAGVLTARWIWIAGTGDYGWTYELGMRVQQGEIPYKDFICTLPQLTSYTMVPFLVLLKGNLWAFSIHLYLWWFAALFVGLKITRILGLRPEAQAGAMLLAACLSFPVIHIGHAYSYAATFFFGLCLLNLIKSRASSTYLMLAGACAGLGIFAKQNIGGVAVLLGLLTVTHTCLIQKQIRLLAGNLVRFCAGVGLVCVPVFLFFASAAGGQEVFRQMFSDAGEGKGGLLKMIMNALPIYYFTPETPHRNFWTLAVSGAGALSFFGAMAFSLARRDQRPALATALPSTRQSIRLLVAAISLVVFASAISIFDMPQVRDLFDRLHPKVIYTTYGYVIPVVIALYSGLTMLALVSLLRPTCWREPLLFLAAASLALILGGHDLSCPGYLPFGAPVAVPLAVMLLESSGMMRNTLPLTCLAGVTLILAQAISTQDGYKSPSFRSLQRLPDDSKFANLWASPDFAARTDELLQNVTPKIRGRPTLWVCVAGPHLAFEGKPVFSVATMHADTYNLRSESVLTNRWQAAPPEFVFVNDPPYCRGSRIFTKAGLDQWLPRHYEPIWKSSVNTATLWQLRAQTNNASYLDDVSRPK